MKILHYGILALVLMSMAGPAGAGGPDYEITRGDVVSLGPGMQRTIAGMQYVLSGYQIRQFFQLPDDSARATWVDRYWKSQDPTPATEENEMRTEHEIRANMARQFFGRKVWPGWDKRGEVFIRYGAPNVRARIPAEVTVRKTHAPGELWFYGRFSMVVVFRDESLTGNYIYAVNALGATQDMTPDLAEYLTYDAADRPLETIIPAEYLEFYRDPEFDPDSAPDYSPLDEALRGPQEVRYTRQRLRGTTERWDESVDQPRDRIEPNNPSTQFIMRQAEEMANRFEETLDETPVAYPFNFEEERFPFVFDVGQFKGGKDLNRIEVNVEFPIEPRGGDEVGESRIYRGTAVFWDADYNEISRTEREVVLPVDSSDTRLMPAQLVFSLEKNYYRMAITVNETRRRMAPDSTMPHAVRESSYRSTVTFKDFEGDLAISDILFAQKITPAEKLSPFNRGAVEVVPHPIRRYKVGSAVPVYFEVYNLGINEDGLTDYEIEYRIAPYSSNKKDRTTDDPVVSSRFQSSGFNADEPLHISVGSQNLDPGTYDLLITVKDEYWQSTASRRATFRIVK